MLTAIVSILYYLVLLAWSLAYFVFMLLLFALTVAFDRERKALHAASRFWARSIFFLNPLWRLRVEGREHIDPKGAYVVTVNHQSMVDIPLMYVLPKINFKWVAKSGVYKWPLFGVVLWLHGDITVDDKGSVRKTLGIHVQRTRTPAPRHLGHHLPGGLAQPRRGSAQLQGGCFPARAGGGSSHPAVCHRRSQNVHQGMAGTVQHLHRAHHPARTRRKGGGDPVREVLAEVRERTVSELAAIRGREKKTEKER